MSSSSITAEQALLDAVQAAGLDPDKPLSEQLGTRADDSEALTARVAELEAELAAAPQQQADPEREFAERFAAKLAECRTPWVSFGGTDAA